MLNKASYGSVRYTYNNNEFKKKLTGESCMISRGKSAVGIRIAITVRHHMLTILFGVLRSIAIFYFLNNKLIIIIKIYIQRMLFHRGNININIPNDPGFSFFDIQHFLLLFGAHKT